MEPIRDEAGLIRVLEVIQKSGTDNQTVEVKSCIGGLTKDLARTISAFSNGSGGMLILGVDERKGFVPAAGFDVGKIQDALSSMCIEKLEPIVRPLMDVYVIDDAPVLVAEIPELLPRDKPCFVRASSRYGGSYIRTGDGDRRLTTYEVDRLMEEHRQPRHDERLVDEATMDDLDQSLLQRLLARERKVHARGFANMDDATMVKKLHIARQDGAGVLRPTLAGLLALGTYPQEFFPRLNVTFTCYPGLTKDDTLGGRRFLDSATLVGPIPSIIDDLEAAVARNARTGAVVEGAFRRDVPDYPPVAVREAVANALMHRDYSEEGCATPVFVDLYRDRLEVTNPGGLYGSVTIATMESALGGSSRNMRLATLLESTPTELGYVAENRGTGYRAIVGELARAGMPAPKPEDLVCYFRLTLVSRGDGRAERLVARTTPAASAAARPVDQPDLNAEQMRIVESVRELGSASITELARHLSVSRSTLAKRVARLVERGVLKPTHPGSSPSRRYSLAG